MLSATALRGAYKAPTLDLMVIVAITTTFVLTLVDGIRVFQQFSWLQVCSVGLAFLILVILLSVLFNYKKLSNLELKFSTSSVVWGLLLGAVLFLFSLTAYTNWNEYFPTAPLQELDAGRGLHPDTVFHVSIIQSILNVGYPSTGQHGLPFIPYHVLSHYVDAGIIALTGLEPLDAYGLLFHFKSFAFLSATVVFLWVVLRGKSVWGFLLSALFLCVVLAGDWLVIGSEGLWFTSILIILSAPLVFRILKSKEFTSSHMWILASLGIAIGIGKVSSGLAFALLVGFFLLFTFPKNLRIYLLGFLWVAFFAWFSVAQDSGSSGGIKLPHLSGITGFLNPWTTYPGGPVEWNLVGIYVVSAVLVTAALVYKSRELFLFVLSVGVSLVLLSLLVMLPAPGGLNQPDIAYFIFGLYFSTVLLGFPFVIEDLVLIPQKSRSVNPPTRIAMVTFLLLFAVLVVPKPDLLQTKFQPQVDPTPTHAALFRSELVNKVDANSLSKSNSRLLLSSEDFEVDISRWGGEDWSRGLAVYALTGVPLLNGINSQVQLDFGQSGYSAEALTFPESKIRQIKACHHHKNIVRMSEFIPPVFYYFCR